MGAINNVRIKNLKWSKDYMGTKYYSGSIYYKNKRLGHFEEIGLDKDTKYEFNIDVLNEPYKNWVLGNKNHPYPEMLTFDCFIREICRISEIEKNFKDCVYTCIEYLWVSGGFIEDKENKYFVKEEAFENLNNDINEFKRIIKWSYPSLDKEKIEKINKLVRYIVAVKEEDFDIEIGEV